MKIFCKLTNPSKETTILGVMSAQAEMMNTDTGEEREINLISVGIIFAQIDLVW